MIWRLDMIGRRFPAYADKPCLGTHPRKQFSHELQMFYLDDERQSMKAGWSQKRKRKPKKVIV